MLRVGVTGGIGSGKTALTDWLATQGVTIVDADLAARLVVRPGQPALQEIADEFGIAFGGLNATKLKNKIKEAISRMRDSRRDVLEPQLVEPDIVMGECDD